MCGIVAGIGKGGKCLIDNVLDGLISVLSRGYDSWGIIGYNTKKKKQPTIRRHLGYDIKKDNLFPLCNLVMGHVRWSTHGKPTLENTHPIPSENLSVYVVHNGTVSNYHDLKRILEDTGVELNTKTDTEIIANCIERDIPLDRIEGDNSFVYWDKREPNQLSIICNGQPLYINYNFPYFVVSDPISFPSHVKTYYKLEKGFFGHLTIDDIYTNKMNRGDMFSREDNPKIEKNIGYRMLYEIKEQANLKNSDIPLNPYKTVLYGCGSSYNAALFASKWCAYNRVEYSTELEMDDYDNYIGISQSGETYDTIKATERLLDNEKSVKIITNNVESTLAKLVGPQNVYKIGAGRELAVASTKTFLGSCLKFTKTSSTFFDKVKEVSQRVFLETPKQIKKNALIFGSGICYPIALEAALKFKEVSYIHAEGMLASELKHGPIALIDDSTISYFIIPQQRDYRLVNNIREIRTRGGYIICVCHPKDKEVKELADEVVEIEEENTMEFALLSAIAFQLLAYYQAIRGGINPDRPRSLAKSVTV